MSVVNCPRCGDHSYDSDRFCSTCGMDLATYRNLWPGTSSGPAPDRVPAPPADTSSVTEPPSVQAPTQTEIPRVPSYSGWATALLALCWPAFWAAIPALVHAGRVESRLEAGDLAGARDASGKARTWCWVTFLAGLVLWAVALALLAIV